ncbi:hypothetical protein [Mesorhizobium sp. B2-4-6]|nr:hypothetical protein [Mesorhizobium sp. B2-4-6]
MKVERSIVAADETSVMTGRDSDEANAQDGHMPEAITTSRNPNAIMDA